MAVRTVTRRSKRRLVIDFAFRRPDGTKGRYRHDAEVQTRAAALAEERRRLAALATKGSPFDVLDETARAQVTPEPPRAPTFAEVADRYLVEFAPSHLKPSSQYSYGLVIRLRLKPTLGTLTLAEITAKTVRDFDTSMVRDGVGHATRRATHIALRSILGKFAVEAELIDRVPRLPPLPKDGKTIPNTMSPDEFQRVLAASRSARLLVLLAGHAGLRNGEVRALRCGDVDLTARKLIVRKSITRKVETTPKSGSEREVPLTPELYEALLAAGVDKRPRDQRVVLSRRGRPYGDRCVRGAFKRALRRANVAHWRFHDLRHFFVTALLNARVPPHVVRELAGHASLATTQKYAHVLPDDRDAAVVALSMATSGKKTEA